MKSIKLPRKTHTEEMNWGQLLNWNRHGKIELEEIDPARSPFQTDYDRIVFSSAFRRLQDKTQVFPLSGSDYIRKRLTHSIEVSSIARSLGIAAGQFILKSKYGSTEVVVKKGDGKQRRALRDVLTHHDFGTIIATAALAHDLGNPPFGHSGEDAVRHWFLSSPVSARIRKELPKATAKDIELWEGNAQGLRILTRLQMTRDNGGMRLTYATLGAFTKYPCSSIKCGKGKAHKKFGFFASEAAIFGEIATECGLRKIESNVWCRHPLAYLMEAADDIAYRIIDLEDGYRLGRLTYEEFCGPLEEIIPPLWIVPTRLALERDDQARASYFRALAISALIAEVNKVFQSSIKSIMAGTFRGDLISKTDLARNNGPLERISNLTSSRIYTTSKVLETEAAGYEVIGGLLDIFWQAIQDMHAKPTSKNRKSTYKARKILQLLPSETLAENAQLFTDKYQQLLLIIDHVTGMTDTFALTLYRKLKGIALPS